jgi:SAM-dependent methyltransferase
VYDHSGGPYDAIYFSASLMLLPDPVAAIKHVAAQLAPDGHLIFTQTIQDRRSPLMERVKPNMHRITTIQFGHVTYEDDFRKVLSDADLQLVEFLTLGHVRNSSFRLAVARPIPVHDDRSAR